MRFTPAASIFFQGAASEPPTSMWRQASSITAASKPSLRASVADHITQKSVARPAGENALDTASFEIAFQPRLSLAIEIEEGGITIHVGVVAFAYHQLRVRDVEFLVQRAVRRALDAMIRPHDLRAVNHFLGGEHFFLMAITQYLTEQRNPGTVASDRPGLQSGGRAPAYCSYVELLCFS